MLANQLIMATEKKERRRHIFKHRMYLEAIADRILTTAPTREIIFNTLLAVYETAHTEGYQLRIEDSQYFKTKREVHRKTSWDMVLTHVDDLIHCRPNINQQSK